MDICVEISESLENFVDEKSNILQDSKLES